MIRIDVRFKCQQIFFFYEFPTGEIIIKTTNRQRKKNIKKETL